MAGTCTFGITGHRDVKQEPGELDQFARLSVARMIDAGATEIITGMARGFDLAIALACYEMKLPFVAAIPFEGQESGWKAGDKAHYAGLRGEAARTYIFGAYPSNRFYFTRDKKIVDFSHQLWALDSGRQSGSHTTVLYAQSIGRTVVPLWRDWLLHRL